MLEKLSWLFALNKCPVCANITKVSGMCESCKVNLGKLKVADNPIKISIPLVDKVFATYYYKNEAKKAVLYAKFKSPAGFLRNFLQLSYHDLATIIKDNKIDAIVSVPAYKDKFYTQEYDLPQEMAKLISKNFNIENCKFCEKTKKTDKQHNLDLRQRKTNLINAFIVNGELNGKNILIVDDIISSGNTVSSLATSLKLAGANEIHCWCYTYNEK